MPAWPPELPSLLEEITHPVGGPEGRERLLRALGRVAELLARDRAQMPEKLVHYLERRSYEKAARYCAEAVTEAAAGGGTSV